MKTTAEQNSIEPSSPPVVEKETKTNPNSLSSKNEALMEDFVKFFYQLSFLVFLLGIFIIWKTRGSYLLPTSFLEDTCSSLCSLTPSSTHFFLSIFGICHKNVFDPKAARCRISMESRKGTDFTSSIFWDSLSSFVSTEQGEIVFLLIVGSILHLILIYVLMGFEYYIMKKIFGGKYWWLKLNLSFPTIVATITYFKDRPLVQGTLVLLNAQITKYLEIFFPLRRIWVQFFYYHLEKTIIPDFYTICRYMVALFVWGVLFQIILLPFELGQRIWRTVLY